MRFGTCKIFKKNSGAPPAPSNADEDDERPGRRRHLGIPPFDGPYIEEHLQEISTEYGVRSAVESGLKSTSADYYFNKKVIGPYDLSGVFCFLL